MLRPVERSITVSAPQRIDQTIFSTSSATEEVTAELPILAFTFTRKLRPMIIGSSSGWLILAGSMGPPRAVSATPEYGGHANGAQEAQHPPAPVPPSRPSSLFFPTR